MSDHARVCSRWDWLAIAVSAPRVTHATCRPILTLHFFGIILPYELQEGPALRLVFGDMIKPILLPFGRQQVGWQAFANMGWNGPAACRLFLLRDGRTSQTTVVVGSQMFLLGTMAVHECHHFFPSFLIFGESDLYERDV